MEWILREVRKLKKKYPNCTLSELCGNLGITVVLRPMGKQTGACKGFFFRNCQLSYVVVNSDLPELVQKIIICHEMAHSVLHKDSPLLKAFHEVTLFDDTQKMEYEANIFAAEYLLDDDRVFEVLNGDLSFSGAAAALAVPVELLDFKWRAMKRRGVMIVDSPMIASSDFLKHIEETRDEDCKDIC